MFLSRASIKRPVAMSALIIALALLGMNAWRKMGLGLFPNTDMPIITIVTVYPGAGPSEIETDVAKRIEDSVGTLDGLKHISSVCMENVCQTMLEFEMGVDVDIAATDVREKLDLVRSDLPSDVEDPIIQKFDVGAKPIVTLALTGSAPLEDLYDYADNELSDRVSIIRGVAEVEVIGGAEREVHVLLDRKQLAARGLTALDVVQAVQNGVRLIPMGRVTEGDTEYSVKFDADYKVIDRIGDLEIEGSGGRRCYIRDVGRVEMSSEELRQSAFIDGEPCVAIRIIKKADANAVEVANGVKNVFADLDARLPGGMELVWVTDDATLIEAINESAWINVLQGVLLTAVILFLFLHDFRTLLVVSVTMPLTIIIGLFFMHLNGFTLNSPTLIAVGMSVGILVTNSIVVLEAIASRLDKGDSLSEAAMSGAGKAFVPVLASAGTNVVVLFPLAMMKSLVGVMIRPLVLTMVIMTLVSLFLSFTLTPMLCSLWLKSRGTRRAGFLGRMEEGWNRGFNRLAEACRRILQFNERHRWAACLLLLCVVIMFMHAMRLGKSIGSGFTSDMDRGEVVVKLEYPTRSSLANTQQQIDRALTRLGDLPGLRHTLVMIGKVEGVLGQSSEGVYLGQIILKFNDRTDRKETIHELCATIRERLADLPGVMTTVSVPSAIGGQSSPIEMQITGPELSELNRLALDAKALADSIKGFRDTDTSVRTGKPELRVIPNRTVLSDRGLPAAVLGMNLRANLEGITAGTFKQGARSYDLAVKLDERKGRKQVSEFQVPGVPGRSLMLTAVADVKDSLTPVSIVRKDRQRATMLYSQLESSLPLGMATKKLGDELSMPGRIPPGYSFMFGGMGEKLAEASSAMGEAGLIAIVLVVLTLAAILESFRQTGLILVTLPLALIGMFWALWLTGSALDILTMMAAVMLIGIVVNNAILIMDQFNQHVREGVPRHKAMIDAAIEQFRPIVMITVAAVIGMLPLAMSRGIGSEIRNNVGIACVGGILVSGVLTLFVIPVLYDLFTRRGRHKQRGEE